jgi:hypothetical protein
MHGSWKRLVGRTGFWLATEIWLNCLGIDNLADYSEFVFARDLELNKPKNRIVSASILLPKFCIKINEYCPIAQITATHAPIDEESVNYPLQGIQQKCKQLKNPCIKVLCSSND